jgi:hypothetical protein
MLAAVTNKTPDEIGAMHTDMAQIDAAIAAINRVSGLEELGKRQAAGKKA